MHNKFKNSLPTITDVGKLKDILSYCHVTRKRALAESLDLADALFEHVQSLVSMSASTEPAKAQEYHDLNKTVALFMAPYLFDRYCIYLEWDREPKKRFYLPRRSVLRVIANDLQELHDRKIRFLSVSLPPRVGKSTLGCFYMTWLMGKYPESASVMSGYSDKLTKGFYKEILSIIQDPQYLWQDVFPNVKVSGISAEDEAISLNGVRRYPTITCRTIGGTLTGAVEVNLCLYCDDLIEDLEEAINPNRLQSKYDAYANQLKDRMKLNAFQLMIGTRWAPADVQGRIQEQYDGNPEYRFRNIPALDDNGESNFNYPYELGFTTEHFLDIRASIDSATWSAKYMGNPNPREGLLYPEEELTTYNGELPDASPVIYAPCDVAWGGGDRLSMPILYRYDDGTVYVHDVVYTGGDKKISRPLVIAKLLHHRPHYTRFEANNGGHEYADIVSTELKELGVKFNITSRNAPSGTSKLVRMLNGATEARDWIFRDKSCRSEEYSAFMRDLTRFNQMGIGKQLDDAPDSLAQGVDLMNGGIAKVEVFRRPF